MPSYTFLGTVLGAGSPISIARVLDGNLEPIVLSCMTLDGSIKFDATVRIVASHVEVVVSGECGEDHWSVGNYVDRLVRTLLDIYGYVNGQAYDLDLGHYIDHGAMDSGNWVKPFRVGALDLRQTVGTTFDELRGMVMLEALPPPGDERKARAAGQLTQALGDIRDAIRHPHDTAVFCFRAIEAIRQHYVEDGDRGPRASWERMGEQLRIDECWTQDIAPARKSQAHGEGQVLSGAERAEFVRRARAVVDRFVASVRNDFNALPDDFDILK